MYLKELRIAGFKSFADPTRISLEPGMTAIVGPNGCGKSNIADAIRWVLGEQSSKSLRAGSMQDVIFQGTTTRKPVNLCEVFLLFTDCEKDLGTAYQEVEVGRRVVRDGGSTYFINGKACRLKDIQRLFLDTGIGQVSYSFMLQGQIDQVLSSNPAERRAIFEEAAGISKYKSQRREALNRLTSVDANLARVTDVLEEVSRQIGSLRRQAIKALKYQRIRHRWQHLELASASVRRAEVAESLHTREQTMQNWRQEQNRQREDLSAAEQRRQQVEEERKTLGERLQELQQQLFHLRSERDHASQQASSADVRAADLHERAKALEGEISRLGEEHRELESRLAGESQERATQMDLFGDSDRTLKARLEELSGEDNAVRERETALQKARQEILMGESQVARLRSTCTSLEVDLQTHQVRHANVTEEIQRHRAEGEEAVAALEEIAKVTTRRQKREGELQGTLEAAREAETKAREAFRALQNQIQDADREVARHQAQITLLEGMQERLEGFGEGAKAVLKGKLGDLLPKDSVRALMKGLRVRDEHWIPALEAVMGPAAEALLTTNPESLLEVFAQLSTRKLGGVVFLQARPKGSEPAGALADPEVMSAPAGSGWTPAIEVVELEGGLAVSVGELLHGCFLAESAEQVLAFLAEHPEVDLHSVATLDGVVFDGRGLIAGGGKVKSGSYLQRSQQLRKANTQRKKARETLEGLRAQVEGHQKALDVAAQSIEQTRRELTETGRELAALREQERAARQRQETATRRLQEQEKARERMEAERADHAKRLEESKQRLQEAEERITKLREESTRIEQAVGELRQQRDERREALSQFRLEVAEKRQRLALLDKGLEEIQRRLREVEQLRLRRRQERDTVLEQRESILAQGKVQAARAKELETSLGQAQKTLEVEQTTWRAMEEKATRAEEHLASIRGKLEQAGEKLHAEELELAREKSELKFLDEKAESDHGITLRDIEWHRELWEAGEALPERFRVDLEDEDLDPAAPPPKRPEPTEEDLKGLEPVDWEALRAEVADLHQRLQAMGAVNLLAIEEYRELQERHQFLQSQSDDLWKAKEQLLQAIDEINTTSEKLFADTFAQIRKNFVFTFTTLFGGGEADLQLSDSEDVLEAGIEITARPPGTRLRQLGLLSGGQRTMTAVGLLFAIYMVKPSPFCVLDEIDAPLDDANIGRFCEMLERFLEYSQFLVITHNKRTISAADIIFGATMQERGVTKMLSMKFNRETEKAEAV